jgi:hypothetical protein
MERGRMKIAQQSDPLVGMWFHSHFEGSILHQGQIMGSCGQGYYMAQLYNWMSGHYSCVKVFHISSMATNWDFYETADEMKDAYEFVCSSKPS